MPPPLDDSVFGRLEWDGDDTLVGILEYRRGVEVTLFFFDASEHELSEFVSRARLAFQRFRDREREYLMRSAEELHVARWNAEEMSPEDVANLLRPATFDFRSDGMLRVYWNDSDILFLGHTLYTEIDPDGEFVEASIQ